MARHDEKTSAGRVKMLSGGDTGDRLAEVDEVLGCWSENHPMTKTSQDPNQHTVTAHGAELYTMRH